MSAANIDYARTHNDWTVEFFFHFNTENINEDDLLSYMREWRGDWVWPEDSPEPEKTAYRTSGGLLPRSSEIRVLLETPTIQYASEARSEGTILQTVTFWIPQWSAYRDEDVVGAFARLIHIRFPTAYATDTRIFHVEDRWARISFDEFDVEEEPAEEDSDSSSLGYSSEDEDNDEDDDESDSSIQLVGGSIFGSEEERVREHRDQIRPPNREAAWDRLTEMISNNRRALMRDREDAQTTPEAVPVFHETDNPSGTRVPLGQSFTIGQFLRLGDFYIEKKLILESFEDGADDECDFLGGNKLYPVIVNKPEGGRGFVYCMTEVVHLLEQSAKNGGNPRNAQETQTREPFQTIHVMTEAEVNAWQNRDKVDTEAQLTKKKKALEELPREIERLETDLKKLKEREKKRKEEREKRRKKRRRSSKESAGAGGGSTSKQQRRALQNLKL
jgi:hypothetical protein